MKVHHTKPPGFVRPNWLLFSSLLFWPVHEREELCDCLSSLPTSGVRQSFASNFVQLIVDRMPSNLPSLLGDDSQYGELGRSINRCVETPLPRRWHPCCLPKSAWALSLALPSSLEEQLSTNLLLHVSESNLRLPQPGHQVALSLH